MIGNYFRLTRDNRTPFWWACAVAMSDSFSDAKSGKVLQAAMLNMFPQLAGVNIDSAGVAVDMTSDRLPRAGQHGGCSIPWATAAMACRCRCTWAR